MVTQEAKQLGKILWDYHHMDHSLRKADCIFVLCSHDLRVADRAVELYTQGFAPYIIFSGGFGNFTEGVFEKPEAELFAERAVALGVPASDILVESKSSNCGENVRFTKKMLAEKGFDPQIFILVQKPFMERRAFATFEKQLPEKHAVVTSPVITYEDYPTEDISLEFIIHVMVGDMQRIKEYPVLGYQTEQEIPLDVWKAYERLVELGFTHHLMK